MFQDLEEVLDSIRTLPSIKVSSRPLCLLCKGKLSYNNLTLCGKPHCPILLKASALFRHREIFDMEKVEGSSPPTVFVGRFGYPKVNVGPLIPPYHGDTSMLDLPEGWVGKPLSEIINFRYSLVWGKTQVNVDDTRIGGRLLELMQELAMGCKPVDGEASFLRKPYGRAVLDGESQPFGPSAPLKDFKASDIKVEPKIEKCYYDHDLKAEEAVLMLYHDKIPISKIHLSLSLGLLGRFKARRLVPTRWSITAVDDTTSNYLLTQMKRCDTIDEYRVYTFRNLDNLFITIFMPGSWNYEWIEAWFPGTVWNLSGLSAQLMGDFEDFDGRTSYASVGGCYYAARLAIAEALHAERKQASVLALREIYSGYILPVGVWNVRESLRESFRSKPQTFQTLHEALNHVFGKLKVPSREWMRRSVLLRRLLFQRKISEYF